MLVHTSYGVKGERTLAQATPMLFSMDRFLCLVFGSILWNKNYCNSQMRKQVFRKVNLSNIVPACKCSLMLDLKLLLLLKRVQRSMWKKMIMASVKWVLIMFASVSKNWYLIANGSDSEFRYFIIQVCMESLRHLTFWKCFILFFLFGMTTFTEKLLWWNKQFLSVPHFVSVLLVSSFYIHQI